MTTKPEAEEVISDWCSSKNFTKRLENLGMIIKVRKINARQSDIVIIVPLLNYETAKLIAEGLVKGAEVE